MATKSKSPDDGDLLLAGKLPADIGEGAGPRIELYPAGGIVGHAQHGESVSDPDVAPESEEPLDLCPDDVPIEPPVDMGDLPFDAPEDVAGTREAARAAVDSALAVAVQTRLDEPDIDALGAALDRAREAVSADSRARERRAAQQRFRASVARAQTEPDPVSALRGLEEARDALAESMPPEARLPTVAVCLAALLAAGPIVRVETGFPTLDTIARGGLWAGPLLTVIGGEPDAGKTSIAAQMALRAARAGHAVLVYASDEDGAGIVRRIAQMEGADRDDVESPDDDFARERVRDVIGRLGRELQNLRIVDQDDAGAPNLATAVQALASMAEAPDCRGPVLVVDSIQKVRASGTEEARDLRARADAVVKALVGFGRRWPNMLTIATSELGRGSYDNPTLAAFKESGSIEHAARHAMIACKVKGDEGAIDIHVLKNKGGNGGAVLRARLDRARCRFTEVERPADGGKSERDDAANLRGARAVYTHVRLAVADGYPLGIAMEPLVARMKGNAARRRADIKRAAQEGWISPLVPRGKITLGIEPPAPDRPCAKCNGSGVYPGPGASGVCYQCHGSGEDGTAPPRPPLGARSAPDEALLAPPERSASTGGE